MSCIARTEELYGAYHIADILRGSEAKKIKQNGHDKLSTYAIGLEWSKESMDSALTAADPQRIS
jgi:ATP-dependent DNA helicase RecQ